MAHEGFDRGDHTEIAERLLVALRDGDDDLVCDDGALHRYEPDAGIWRRVQQGEESCIVQGFAGAPVGEKGRPLRVQASDVSGASKLAHDRVASLGFFADGPPGVVFANGFVTVNRDGVHVREHAPENRARLALPFPYDPLAPCPTWIGFLDAVFAPDDDREEKIAFLSEFAGACFLGIAPRYQRAVVELGAGANGKSVVIAVIGAAFPREARSAIAPQLWTSEYRRAQLAGVRFNAVSELPEQDILESEAFKAIVTGDETDARPIRQASFTFRPVAGHLFAANNLPGTNDLTDGFWRRLVVVQFNRQFAPDEQDADLADRIIAAELPGVVAWMLAGAHRLIARGRYEVPPSSLEAVSEWKRTADTVGMFLEEWTSAIGVDYLADRKNWTQSSRVFSSYQRWAPSCGFRPVSIKKFAARCKALGRAPEHADVGTIYPLTLKTGAP